MTETPKPADPSVLTFRIKPPEWTDKSGEGFRLFKAQTSLGEFVYGVDFNGQAYHQGLDMTGRHEEVDHPTEDAAKIAAEAGYSRLVMRDFLAVSEPYSPPKPVLKEAKVVAELRDILVKYADECEDARSYGGPTMLPHFPLDEGKMRVFGMRLDALDRELVGHFG
ncbi:hypothetical protein [Rhizobium sp. BK176]|uniref:hypothetical protein n=1 Tax=Rhizobium sp. BK176 TaxID=2587071 RepID=UPI002167A30A|nr:hypothetical protein [Rhizobium sp. BK176]MCS4089162.1 hypothetical protein [Rhizobium sp. BK176]